MLNGFEGLTDWEAKQKFRGLPNDALRQEQLFDMVLSLGRGVKEVRREIGEVRRLDEAVDRRTVIVERRLLQSAAVITFLVIALPLLFAAAALLK